MAVVDLAIAPQANLDLLALQSGWGLIAGDAAILLHQVVHAALGVDAQVLDVALVHPIDHGFHQAAFGAIGNLVVEAEDDIAAPAQIGLVELGIVEIAGEAVVFPEQQAMIAAIRRAKMAEHGFEALTPHRAGSGGGFVFEDLGEGAALFAAPGADGFLLLFEGEILLGAAAIAQVGDQAGVFGESHGESGRLSRIRLIWVIYPSMLSIFSVKAST